MMWMEKRSFVVVMYFINIGLCCLSRRCLPKGHDGREFWRVALRHGRRFDLRYSFGISRIMSEADAIINERLRKFAG